MDYVPIATGVLGMFCGLTAGLLLKFGALGRRMKNAEKEAERIIENAKKMAEVERSEVAISAKEEILRTRTEFETSTKERRQELMQLEKRLNQREDNLDKKLDLLQEKDTQLQSRDAKLAKIEKSLRDKHEEIEELKKASRIRLEEISRMSTDEARNILMSQIEEEARRTGAATIKRIEEETKGIAEKKSKEILTLAIQKCAADHVVETTVSSVSLPNEEMKGRIIGREGRNIRALETATGVDVIIDDTPEAVVLSSFDPIRREIARVSLERLIMDGRIHPGRIEEIVAKVKKEMEKNIREAGEQSAFDVKVHNLHQEAIKLLGRLKYRTSYGQNVLKHSEEVAYLAGVMAGELNMDVSTARRAGLLHDLGKAVDHEIEGSHAMIGADLVRRFGEPTLIVNSVAAHHEEVPPESLLAVLIQAADALSAARPGARRETLETYVRRLEQLEGLADGFEGVSKSFAIQAGREIRVVVEPEKLTDDGAMLLASDVARKIENELEYPGQIKVTVVREVRAVDYAK